MEKWQWLYRRLKAIGKDDASRGCGCLSEEKVAIGWNFWYNWTISYKRLFSRIYASFSHGITTGLGMRAGSAVLGQSEEGQIISWRTDWSSNNY